VIYRGIRISDHKTVAIKLHSIESSSDFIRDSHSESEHAIQKFRREIGILYKIRRYPGMSTILGAGDIEGIPYHITEWVPGRSVLEVLTRGACSLTVREKAKIVINTARSVQRLHEEGLVHRDIAPYHVFLTPDCRTCIIDFGMAEFVRENSVKDATCYRLHDIYSTGLLLYELLIEKQVLSYGRPSLTREVARAFSELQEPPALTAVIKRAMLCNAGVATLVGQSINPYQNISSFIRDLKRFLEKKGDWATFEPRSNS